MLCHAASRRESELSSLLLLRRERPDDPDLETVVTCDRPAVTPLVTINTQSESRPDVSLPRAGAATK